MANRIAFTNKFILNSDFMSVASAGNESITVVIPAGTLVPTGETYGAPQATGFARRNLSVKTPNGALTKLSMTYKPTNTPNKPQTIGIGNYIQLDNEQNGITYAIYIYRVSNERITVEANVSLEQGYPLLSSFPSITFTLNLSYFYPPNVA